MFVKTSTHLLELTLILCVLLSVSARDASDAECSTLDREPGECIPALKCEAIRKLLSTAERPVPRWIVQQIKDSACGAYTNVLEVRVCCKIDNFRMLESPENTMQGDVGSSSNVRASADGSESDVRTGIDILKKTKCGDSSKNKVANGINAELLEFAWMALLIYEDGIRCSGTLITERYVLTAAHCIASDRKQKLLRVRLGEHNTSTDIDCKLNGECAPPVQEIDVEEAIYHASYDPAQFSDDIGLIRLTQNAKVGIGQYDVQPICLPITSSSKNACPAYMIIAGWGRITNSAVAEILQKATIPVRDNKVCRDVHRIIDISDKQICAGGENNVDSCKGDSGGPIFYTAKYKRHVRYVQFGIISAGSTACGTEHPALYTKITSYLAWIAGNIKP